MADEFPEQERRKSPPEMVEQFDKHAQEVEDRLERFIRKALIAFAIIGLSSALGLLGFGVAITQIKDNRELFVRSECESTNKKNEDTSARLIAASDADQAKRKTAAEKMEVQRRRDVTLALIDALAPVEDCDYKVALAMGDVTPTPTPETSSTPFSRRNP